MEAVARTGAALGAVALLLPIAGPVAADGKVAWERPVDVAQGDAYRGPWRMNESDFRYVDDATVALGGKCDAAVAWADQADQDVYLQRFTEGASPRFDAPVNVSRSGDTFSWLPRVVVSSAAEDHVFVAWQEIIFAGGSHGGDILFARSTDGGRTFDEPVNLSDNPAGAGKGRLTAQRWDNGSLDLVEAPDGTVHIAWTEYEGALRVVRSTDGGASFSGPLRVADNDDAPARAPALAVEGADDVYLSWTVGEDAAADIHLARSDDGGRSFEAPEVVAETGAHSDAPALAVHDGTFHIAYTESEGGPLAEPRVHYLRGSAGGEFTAPKEISDPDGADIHGAGFPAMAVAGDRIVVVWERFPERGQRPVGLELVPSRDAGDTFTAPERVPGIDNADGGVNGSLQGLLGHKLAVDAADAIAVVNSTFRQGQKSDVRLVCGALP